MSRGVFSTDVGVAALIMMLTAFICVLSLKSTAHSLAWEARLGSAESSALRLADFMLKECDAPGLSECDSLFAYSHVLSSAKIGALAANAGMLERIFGNAKKAGVRVFGLDGSIIASAGGAAGENAACVRRIVLLEGREVVLEACSE